MPMRPRSGSAFVIAPQEVVVELLGRRLLERDDLQPCGFTPDMTCLIVPSLPAASIAWKTTSSA